MSSDTTFDLDATVPVGARMLLRPSGVYHLEFPQEYLNPGIVHCKLLIVPLLSVAAPNDL